MCLGFWVLWFGVGVWVFVGELVILVFGLCSMVLGFLSLGVGLGVFWGGFCLGGVDLLVGVLGCLYWMGLGWVVVFGRVCIWFWV